MTVADIIAQGIERQVLGSTPEKPREYDPHRTVRFAVVGLTLHGPYFKGFAMVDNTLGRRFCTGSPRGTSSVKNHYHAVCAQRTFYGTAVRLDGRA